MIEDFSISRAPAGFIFWAYSSSHWTKVAGIEAALAVAAAGVGAGDSLRGVALPDDRCISYALVVGRVRRPDAVRVGAGGVISRFFVDDG